MRFTEQQYQDNLNYVDGIFTLGGLSECGKTTAGKHFQEIGVRKSKIIQIEYDMMRENGIDPSLGTTPEQFEDLYRENPDKAFKEFLFRLIEKMKEEGFKFASLESLYRAPLGAFIKKELGAKAANIYIEAPVEARAYREMIKVNQKVEEEGGIPVTLQEMIDRVNEKDKFKMERNATAVKDIADYVVDNSEGVSKEQFVAKIDAIARAMGVTE